MPEQLRNIDIQGAVGLSTREQLMDRRQGCRNGVCRCPRSFEEIEADFSSPKVDVWVTDGRTEFDGWRGERVGWGDGDGKEPPAA